MKYMKDNKLVMQRIHHKSSRAIARATQLVIYKEICSEKVQC
jgi:hypothetical protein